MSINDENVKVTKKESNKTNSKKNNAIKATSSKSNTTKNNTKSNSSTKKASTSSKKTNNTKTTSKKDGNTTAKKSSVKKSTTNNKKTNNSVSKTKTKKIETNVKKIVEQDIQIIDDKGIEEKVVEVKEIIEEKNEEIKPNIEENYSTKIENAKFTIRRSNKLAISIGVFISLLGIIALIITLIANRIIDREFISDTEILFMVIISIVIEIMGAAIIIKET